MSFLEITEEDDRPELPLKDRLLSCVALDVVPQNTSAVVKLLQTSVQHVMESGPMRHLKRVRRVRTAEDSAEHFLSENGDTSDPPCLPATVMRVLVCSSDEWPHRVSPSTSAALKEKALRLVRVKVPRFPPKDSAQRLWESRHVWPLNRIAPSGPPPPPPLTEEESADAREFLQMALRLASRGKALGYSRGIGAVIVDPSVRAVRASGFDRSSHVRPDADTRARRHPFQTAVMMCLAQIGSADRERFADEDAAIEVGMEDVHPRAGTDVIPAPSLADCPGKVARMRRGMSELPRRKRRRSSFREDDDTGEVAEDREKKAILDTRWEPFELEAVSLLEPLPVGAAEAPSPGRNQYVCNGYDVYVTLEPGPMDAMALVHARARRIFVGCADSLQGAVLSRLRVHMLGSLNHRYRAFVAEGSLRDECARAAGEDEVVGNGKR